MGIEAPIADSTWLLLFRSRQPYYWIAFFLALFTLWATFVLVRSKTGYYWRAINGDEGAARSLGVPAERCKMRAFVLSAGLRSEEHTSELQSLMRISYAVFCLKKKIT